MFGSDVFPAVGGGKSMRTVSFFGSFESAMERNNSILELIDQKSWACHQLTLAFEGKMGSPLRQKIVAASSSDPAPNKLADGHGFR
jgi:hypothetical protein